MSKADELEALNCYSCGGPMITKHRTETERFVRVLWHCKKCDSQYSKMYSDDETSRRERRQRGH